MPIPLSETSVPKYGAPRKPTGKGLRAAASLLVFSMLRCRCGDGRFPGGEYGR